MNSRGRMGTPSRVRVLLRVIIAGLAALVILSWIASPVATKVVNRKLAGLGEYRGEVGRVAVSIWRGTVTLHDLSILPRETDPGANAAAVLKVSRARLSLAFRSLLSGRIGGEGAIDGMDVWIELGPVRSSQGSDDDELRRRQRAAVIRRWQTELRETFPMELASFAIRDARIHVVDPTVPGSPEVLLDQVTFEATGLRNAPPDVEGLPARLVFSAACGGRGLIRAEVSANPAAPALPFRTKLEVRDLPLPELSPILRRAIEAHITAGTFELYAEIEGADTRYTGYLKPFVSGLAIEPASDNPLKNAAVRVTRAVTGLLENEKDKVATQVPFEGNLEETDPELWTAVEMLLRNAFIAGLREGLG